MSARARRRSARRGAGSTPCASSSAACRPSSRCRSSIVQHRAPESHPIACSRRCSGPSRGSRCAKSRTRTIVRPGTVYVAPADYHLLVERRHARALDRRARALQPPVDRRARSQSAADAYGERCVGVVLTGANADGAQRPAPHRRARRAGDRPGPRDGRARRDAAAALARGADARRCCRSREIAPLLVELCGRREA